MITVNQPPLRVTAGRTSAASLRRLCRNAAADPDKPLDAQGKSRRCVEMMQFTTYHVELVPYLRPLPQRGPELLHQGQICRDDDFLLAATQRRRRRRTREKMNVV